MKSKSGKFNSGQGNNSLLLGLGGVLVVLLLFLAYVSFIIVRDSNHDKEYAGHASDLRVLSQEIAKTQVRHQMVSLRRLINLNALEMTLNVS